MTALTIISRAGKEVTVAECGDRSVMEVIRDANVEERFALCQGSLSCATCHVYVDPDFMDRMTPATDYELDLLSSSDYQKGNSRLSCQIPCNATLDGLRVTVAPED